MKQIYMLFISKRIYRFCQRIIYYAQYSCCPPKNINDKIYETILMTNQSPVSNAMPPTMTRNQYMDIY